MDDFIIHPDAVQYQIRLVVWAADSTQERGLRSMELQGLDSDGVVVHKHSVEFDGSPYYPTLPSMHAIVLSINEGLADGLL